VAPGGGCVSGSRVSTTSRASEPASAAASTARAPLSSAAQASAPACDAKRGDGRTLVGRCSGQCTKNRLDATTTDAWYGCDN
jgi:hypothetical protein